jgi:segregation and condensation protein A
MRRNREFSDLTVKPEKTIGNLLSYRTISITARIYGIMRHLYKDGDTGLQYFIFSSGSRSEIIATFVALLELLGSQRITIINEREDSDYILHLAREHNRK